MILRKHSELKKPADASTTIKDRDSETCSFRENSTKYILSKLSVVDNAGFHSLTLQLEAFLFLFLRSVYERTVRREKKMQHDAATRILHILPYIS